MGLTRSSEGSASARGLLIFAGVATMVAWQFPLGRQILYPFTLLATYAHEMGHGISAVLLGARFESLEMYPNGSGLAQWRGDVGRLGRAAIAAGGLIGPAIAGALLLVLSKKKKRAHLLLHGLAIFLVASIVLVARSAFALVFIGAAAATFFVIARFLPRVAPFFVQLVGVELCLSVFRDVSYMFSEGAVVDGVKRPSDSAAIAEALLFPYWFWGALTAAFSFLVLFMGLYLALRGEKTRRPEAQV